MQICAKKILTVPIVKPIAVDQEVALHYTEMTDRLYLFSPNLVLTRGAQH